MAILNLDSLTNCSSIPDFISSGTLMIFQQTNAPVSWAKSTTDDDSTLRVVSGTAAPGGTSAFTTVFASRSVPETVGDTTLATTQIPSHTHTYSVPPSSGTFSSNNPPFSFSTMVAYNSNVNSGPTGGSGAHTHPFSGPNMDFAVQYIDVIIAIKS